MKKEFYDALIQLTEEKNVLTDEPLKNHVTFRVGGAADYFVSPESAEEVQKIILLCKEAGMPYYILGNGFYRQLQQRQQESRWLDLSLLPEFREQSEELQ